MASWAPHEDTNVRTHGDPDPKPQRRVRASQRGWSDLHESFVGQSCLACWSKEIELHHVTPRSQSGSDVRENLAPLCHRHHMILEDHSPGWRLVAHKVREYVLDDNARTAYVMETLGESRFAQRYPAIEECRRNVWCASFDGHHGECLRLSDQAYQPREEREPTTLIEGVEFP